MRRRAGTAARRLCVVVATTAAFAGAAPGANIEPPHRPARPAQRMPAAAVKAPAAEPAFRVTSSQPRIDPLLLRAYETLSAGELAAAAADYALVLKADANNADALHGLAVVALRRGRFGDAEEFYLRAVHADPRDAIAVAGLFGLRGYAVPVDAESQLKSLIAEQPWQHALHFALGNVYAATGRWSEAQQAFFSASGGADEHPDYLFNLAVSLDHLRQSSLAARYYSRAIAAAKERPAAFDTTQAEIRLRALLR